MRTKHTEKEQAILLRRQGCTYSEILRQVPVAKSTLSLWFMDVGLSVPQQQAITEKKLAAGRRGGEARRRQRLESISEINKEARRHVTHVSGRDLWLMGIMLYWAEGTKDRGKANAVSFSNTDPRMLRLFILWLEQQGVGLEKMIFTIYIHETARERLPEVRRYWSRELGIEEKSLEKVVWKRHIPKRVYEPGKSYVGLIRINVHRSSKLNRYLSAWVCAIVEKIKDCPIV